MVTKLRQSLGEHEFAVPTTLSADEILRAAQRAERAAEPATESHVALAAKRPDGIAYQVTGSGDLFQLTFAVTWTEPERGTRRVRLAVGDYLTTRTRWMHVPVGPRTAPGLAALARFSDWMQKELSSTGSVAATG